MYLILLAIAASAFVIASNLRSYFNPLTFCKIKIELGSFDNHRKEIKQGISWLKKNDSEAYRDLCKNVDKISEKICVGADPNVDMKLFEEIRDKNGCYVRGSKIIYINPHNFDEKINTQTVAGYIKTYSEMSKNFWEN
jgi:hypothetical protein